MKEKIQAFNNNAFQTLQRSERKMFCKREENRDNNSHVLSMRPYAHIQAKHAKRGLLVKTCLFTLLGT